jgi:hypothetical protein
VLTKDGILTLVDVVLSTQHKQIYFPDVMQLKDSLPLMQFKPKKGTIVTNNSPINSSHQQLMYLDVDITKPMC